jgi:pantothenate kinase-related protein Tda10
MADYLLSEAEHERIFTENILPNFEPFIVPQESPRAVILGGPGGSGKSEFINLERKRNSSIVTASSDDLRAYHTDYPRLLREDEQNAPDLIQDDCNY